MLTQRYDNARSGANQLETILTPQNVNQQSFGRLFRLPTDGAVYAEPLYKSQLNIPGQGTHNVLFVATEHDSVYAFDADGNNPAQAFLWHVSFINPANGVTTASTGDVGTSDINPEIGITGTPVIDPSSNTLYVVAKTKESSSGQSQIVQRLHALDLATGAEKMSGPVQIQASVSGNGLGSQHGIMTFDPRIQNQRAGLVLANGRVYIAWGSHGDMGNYHGWVIGYNASNVQQQLGAYLSTPNGGGGGIWMSGGGISADNNGSLFVASGNGAFEQGGSDYGDSAVRLSTAGGGLSVADSFTPKDQQTLSVSDSDMGTSAVLLLPDQPGPYAHLAVTADKSGAVYLLNRDNLGAYNSSQDGNVQTVQLGSTIHNSVSYFNNTLYVCGDGNFLQAYGLSNGQITPAATSHSGIRFGNNGSNGSGASPIISANGTANGIVWALNNFSNPNGPAILSAYDAINLATLLYSSDQAAGNRDTAGNAVKFTFATVINGKVFVPGVNTVTVYGILSSAQPPASTTAAPTYNPGPGTVFSTPQSVALLDSTPNATMYYTTDGNSPSTASATYSQPVPITGPTSIKAFASAPGLQASQIVSAFYTVQSASNTGAPDYSGGFTSSGLSLNGGAKIQNSRLQLTDGGISEARSTFFTTPVNVQHFATQFSFQLTNPQAEGFTFTIQNDSASAIGSPGSGLGFGPDPAYQVSSSERSVRQSVGVKFDLRDNGSGEGPNSTGIYLNGANPSIPALDMTSSGINLHSGHIFTASMVYDGTALNLTIVDNSTSATFATSFNVDIPTVVGGATAYIGFTASTSQATAIQEILQWSFNPSINYSSGFTASGLTMNGAASINGSRLRLTDGGTSEATSAYFNSQVNIASFTADFQFQISNPGGDGFTFVIQNSSLQAVGAAGGGLGYGSDLSNAGKGIANSVALKFDLSDNGGEGPNSTGLFTGGVAPYTPAVNLSPSGVDLHSGDIFAAHLTYNGSVLAVTIADKTKPSLQYTGSFPVNIPQAVGSTIAYVGFTGSTGGHTATQDILSFTFTNSSATSSGPPNPPPAQAAAPTFTPVSGTVLTSGQTVSIADSTANSTIFYTTDGSTPGASSTKYVGPFQVLAAVTIKAIATGSGFTTSPVASASYSVAASAPPSVLSYPSGFTASGLAMNGKAAINGARIRLTDGGSSEATSAYFNSPVNIASFTADFQFQITNPGGDGFTFVIQNSGLQAVGAAGGGLGYGSDLSNAGKGIANSVALKFDLSDNNGEGPNSTGVFIRGVAPYTPAVNLSPSGIDLHSGHIFAVHLTYNGTVLTVTVTDKTKPALQYTGSFPVNIQQAVGSKLAYVGFTGATGGHTATQDILSFTFTN